MDAKIASIEVSAYNIPTDSPESDGTLEWNQTTMVLVEVQAGAQTGLGFTYADTSTAHLILTRLKPLLEGQDAMAINYLWQQMAMAVRNLGRPGIASMAMAAVDLALWDLKARLLNIPLVTLLGPLQTALPVYGSGGFTSYPAAQLQQQLADWASAGIREVKMKVGREPDKDLERVRAASEAIGNKSKLLVDANGAYDLKQALYFANAFAEMGVVWFEEPVTSDDLTGLRFLRDRSPPGMEIAAGEYGYDLNYFDKMLRAGAVDVLQVDVTRCAGITEMMRVGGLAAAAQVPVSTHTAPSMHLHPACALFDFRNLEFFHDHVRIEQMLFDGVARVKDGVLEPDLREPGNGLEFKRQDASQFAVS